LGRALDDASCGLPDDGSRGLPDHLAALAPLVEVRQHRSRIGCALLPWQALAAARKESGS